MKISRAGRGKTAICIMAMLMTAACSAGGDADGSSAAREAREGDEDSGGGETTDADELSVFRYGSSSQPRSLDPRASATFDPIFLIPVYDSLLKRDVEGEVVPSLAESWTLGDGATSLELKLRDGVTFQDGAPLDAEAVKANIESNQSDNNNLTAPLSVIEEVEAVDSTTVVLHFAEPSSHMLGVLAGEAGMMISPDAMSNADIETNPVGTGPFKIAEYDQSGITYEAWDGYWDRDRIQIDQIDMSFLLDEEARLRALISGQVDAAPIRSNQKAELASSSPDVELATGNAAFVYGIMMNTSHSELSNPAMRKAMIHGIDRQAINEAFFDGDCEPLVQPYPSSYWAHTPGLEDGELGKYDPDTARTLLQEAGLEGVDLALYVGQAAVFQSVAETIQAQLGDVGMNVTVEKMENTALVQARRDGDFEASIASVQSGRPDPAQFVQDFYTPDGVFNHGGTEFEGVTEPLATLQGTDDPTERQAAMQEIVTTVMEQGPNMVPICSALVLYAHYPYVEGIEIPVNYDYDLTGVSIDR